MFLFVMLRAYEEVVDHDVGGHKRCDISDRILSNFVNFLLKGKIDKRGIKQNSETSDFQERNQTIGNSFRPVSEPEYNLLSVFDIA